MKMEQIGKLAMRQEGQMWNAYYAPPDKYSNRIFLGSIRMSAVSNNESRRLAFMQTMREVVSDMLQDILDVRPEWPDDPTPAPESERAGHS